MSEKAQKIIKFSAQNMMRLRAVEITPEGDLVVVGGRNAQGKTSVLNSIAMAIGGGAEIPDEPIRRGEKKAQVVLELEDLIVVRTFRVGKASKIEVKAKDGAKLQSPQKVLDALMGGLKKHRLTFDPLEFCRADGRKQLDILKQIVTVDVGPVEQERQRIFEERTDANREFKRLQGAHHEAPFHEGAPDEVSLSELFQERDKADDQNRENIASRKKLSEDEGRLARAESELNDARDTVLDLETQVAHWKESIEKSKTSVESLEDIDIDPIDARIGSVEEDNKKARENAEHIRLMKEAETAEEKAERLTAKINSLDEKKRAMLAEAPFPVPGLGFSDEGISFNDLPFEQASQAEQLRVAVAIGLAMNPELRVLLIRDGSLLDQQSLAKLAELATESKAQLWVERVGDGDECSVIIEDGQVKA